MFVWILQNWFVISVAEPEPGIPSGASAEVFCFWLRIVFIFYLPVPVPTLEEIEDNYVGTNRRMNDLPEEQLWDSISAVPTLGPTVVTLNWNFQSTSKTVKMSEHLASFSRLLQSSTTHLGKIWSLDYNRHRYLSTTGTHRCCYGLRHYR